MEDLQSLCVWNSTATLATPLDGFNTYFWNYSFTHWNHLSDCFSFIHNYTLDNFWIYYLIHGLHNLILIWILIPTGIPRQGFSLWEFNIELVSGKCLLCLTFCLFIVVHSEKWLSINLIPMLISEKKKPIMNSMKICNSVFCQNSLSNTSRMSNLPDMIRVFPP